MRVDAHQHYWHYNPVRDGWIGPDMQVLRRDFLPPNAAPALREAGIDAVVAVQADQSERETDLLLAVARLYPVVRGVVGWVDLRGDALSERLARWRGNHNLKGFRHIAQAEADDFLVNPEVVRGVQQLGTNGYSFDLLVYPRQLPACDLLVGECGDTTFILDHGAKPPIATGELGEWATDIRQLARHHNVSCKLSGFVTEASWHSWTPGQIVPYLDALLDCFGPERLMFGSDWPVCLLAADYRRVYDVIADWSARMSQAEQALLFGGTAARVYQLEGGG